MNEFMKNQQIIENMYEVMEPAEAFVKIRLWLIGKYPEGKANMCYRAANALNNEMLEERS